MPEFIRGKDTKIELVSRSHGAYRVPLAQSFDYTPKFTDRTIYEFDNPEPVATIVQFDGIDIRFGYYDSESKLVDAAVNDFDPSGVVINDPSNLKIVDIVLNIKDSTGTLFESIFCKEVQIKGQGSAEPVREESLLTVDGTGLNVIRIKRHAILYTRVLANSPDVSVYGQDPVNGNSETDQNFPATAPFKITLNKKSVELPRDFGYGTRALLVKKNGVLTTTGYILSTSRFEVTSEPEATDVWEVYTIYDPTNASPLVDDIISGNAVIA